MNHRRFHWLEKIHVQLATVLMLAVVYFVVWPMVAPWDAQGPVNFIPNGNYAQLAAFAASIWVLAAVCAAATTSVRPQGAMLAVFVGAAGISLHSHPIRPLLWVHQENLPALYLQLVIELLVLAAVMFAAAVIIGLVRAAVWKLRPGWLWRDPLTAPAELESSPSEADRPAQEPSLARAALWPLPHVFGAPGRSGKPGPKRQGRAADAVSRLALCAASSALVAAILLMLLMQSSSRGQIIFAMFASFLLAVMISHQLFASPLGIVAWAIPVAVGLAFYGLAAATSISGPQAWMKVRYYARALPIDWVTEGSGGALLGYWISSRIHELRHFERREESEQ